MSYVISLLVDVIRDFVREIILGLMCYLFPGIRRFLGAKEIRRGDDPINEAHQLDKTERTAHSLRNVMIFLILIAGVLCVVLAGSEQQKLKQTYEPSEETQRPAISDADFLKLCEIGDVQGVEEAILNGANVNARDDSGYTALMRTAVNSRTETAELLLKHGANVNAKDNSGGTALMRAALPGNTETAELLLKHGANVNAKDNSGRTALMRAVSWGNIETIKLLRSYGAK